MGRGRETDDAVHVTPAMDDVGASCSRSSPGLAGLASGLVACSQPYCRVRGNAGGTLALSQGAAVRFAAWMLLLPPCPAPYLPLPWEGKLLHIAYLSSAGEGCRRHAVVLQLVCLLT